MRNRADRLTIPIRRSNNNARLRASLSGSPANRALHTPGAPSSASTSRPVSSAMASAWEKAATASALMTAFSNSVEPVSCTSPSSAGRGTRCTMSVSSAFISSTLCTFADAHTNTMSGCVTVYEKVLPAEAERLPLTALASQRCALIPLMPDRAKNLIRFAKTPFLLLCLVPRQNAALLRSLT